MTQQYLFFDTETSGFIKKDLDAKDSKQQWCCQIGAILTDSTGHVIDSLDTLIKANGREIPSFLTQNVHGISVEMTMKSGIEEVEALEYFAFMMTETPKRVCHNYAFDFAFLDQMFQRQMDELSDIARSKYFLQLPHFCTMKDKSIKTFCGLKNKLGRPKVPKLEELYNILFEKDFPDAHNAMADATATKDCFFELIKRGVIEP